ncbi:MAG: PucR family transcriptional regulator ligand-binding domain-containing protein [Oscillospiraceae bacterium]
MLKISDLLKAPSLQQSYIIAGHDGMFNTVKKLEIMEEPYPAVLEFLVTYEFLMTNFWSMKNDKQGRIDLVKNMIEKRCAGLGIMPEPHLDNIIDPEIIELANKNSFPIIYIDVNARWGDVVSEYGVLAHSSMMPSFDSKLESVLISFSEFNETHDCNEFCTKIAEVLDLPVIMSTNTIYSANMGALNVAQVVSKIQMVKKNGSKDIASPITVRVQDDYIAIVHFGEKSFIAVYIQTNMLNFPTLKLFHKLASTVTKELDKLCPASFGHENHVMLRIADVPMFYVLIKKENIANIEKEIDYKYTVYEKNTYFNYCVMLIPNTFEKNNEIYSVYQQLMQKLTPDLFIFSIASYNKRELIDEIEPLKYTVNTLSYLDGIYSTDELPLLYILSYAPYEYKSYLFKALNKRKRLKEEEKSFLDTLRLYSVLHSMVDVANLLGIHANSVKYRLSKALANLGYEEDSMLGDLSSLKLLIQLELIMIEN